MTFFPVDPSATDLTEQERTILLENRQRDLFLDSPAGQKALARGWIAETQAQQIHPSFLSFLFSAIGMMVLEKKTINLKRLAQCSSDLDEMFSLLESKRKPAFILFALQQPHTKMPADHMWNLLDLAEDKPFDDDSASFDDEEEVHYEWSEDDGELSEEELMPKPYNPLKTKIPALILRAIAKALDRDQDWPDKPFLADYLNKLNKHFADDTHKLGLLDLLTPRQVRGLSSRKLALLCNKHSVQALKEVLISPEQATAMPYQKLEHLTTEHGVIVLREQLTTVEIVRSESVKVRDLEKLMTKNGLDTLRELKASFAPAPSFRR